MLNPEIPKVSQDNEEAGGTFAENPGMEIGAEHSMWAEPRLMWYMIPEELKSLIVKSDGEHPANEDEIFLAWNEYFSSLFRDFWNIDPVKKENRERLQRVMLETEAERYLTEEDYQAIVDFFPEDKKIAFIEKVQEILQPELG